jgi:cytosine/adenosine deaminase-related metal-dependent hydrolase
MGSTDRYGDFTAEGFLLEHGEYVPCTVVRSGGSVSIDRSEESRPDFRALFVKDMVNAHTHCGDYGLSIPPGMGIEELVAPPDGLKHRYLAGLSQEQLADSIARFDSASSGYGSSAFIDFREGGAAGCRMLRQCSEDAVILGRPVSKEHDPEEMAEILSVADGIGLPSISDMPMDYIEAIADDVRRERKILAIHASERIREDIDAVLSLDPAFVVHMCEATDGDMTKCAEAEVPVVVCPPSSGYFGIAIPIRRMLDRGMDVAVGTDNGMFGEPDLIAATRSLADTMEAQGGEPGDAWTLLSNFACKLLYRTNRMEERSEGRYLTVIPRGNPADGRPFRIKINRGVN